MKKIIQILIFLVHLFWTLTLLASLPLTIIYYQYHNVAIILVASTLIMQLIFRGRCPLTFIENYLRDDPYDSTFLGYILRTYFNMEISDFWVEVIIGIYFTILVLLSLPWHGMGF